MRSAKGLRSMVLNSRGEMHSSEQEQHQDAPYSLVQTGSTSSNDNQQSLAGSKRNATVKVKKLLQLAQDDHDLIEALKRKNAELQSQLNGRMDSVGSIQRNFENLSKMYQSEKERADRMEEKSRETVEKVKLMHEQLQQMQQLKDHVLHFQKSHQELLEKNHQTEALMNEKIAQNMRLQQRIEGIASDMQQSKRALEQAGDKLRMGQEKQRSAEDEIKVLKMRLKETIRDASAKTKTCDELQSELAQKQAKLTELESQNKMLGESNNENKNISQQLASLKRERLIMSKSLQSAEASLSDLQEREKFLQKEFKREMRDREMAETELAMLREKLNTKKSNDENLEEQLNKVRRTHEQDVEKLHEKIENLDEQCGTLKEQNQNLLSMLQAASTKSQKLQSAMTPLKEENALFAQKFEEQNRHVDSLNNKIDKQQVEIHRWRTKFEKVELKKASTEELLEKFRQVEASYKKKIKTTKHAVDDLVQQNRELSEKYQQTQRELQDMMAGGNTKMQSMQTRIDELKEDVDEYQKQISEMTSELRAKDDTIETHLAKIDQHETTIQALNDRCTELAASNDTQIQQIAELKTVKSEKLHMRAELDETKLRLTQAESENQQNKDLAKEMEFVMREKKELQNRLQFQEEQYKKNFLEAELKWQAEKKKLMAAPIVEQLQKREKQVQDTIQKLIKTEKASTSALTCMKCFNLFDRPMTCVPCGHVFCKECLGEIAKESRDVTCPECDQQIQTSVNSEIIDILAGKSEYRKQTLESLKNLTNTVITGA
eukprot:CAMPEP_0117450278 /NCGR_PEP_ID=MMETSP0759-20121206/8383_1 /TAXON_ID=63605 /ORGANISM="Percolomonas cosmopolitus, Strain WS" /LENGTH=774 /DNA_ID=CAMNT_0005242789 /DNA_START=291 /DNA_END=2611 /DNA_ORIENTATION=+